jgi:CheY-like chemotaxis protein
MGGTGLGMSITKELIELMGGSIDVQSSKGAGSAFFVRIEFLKGLPSDLPAKQLVIVNGDLLKGKTILVADDNEMNRLVAEAVLQHFGAIVLQANNGLEAIASIRQRLPDLVLMDIQMPELNGYEATAIIRRDLKLELPIIALTANAIKGESEKCIEAGMNDYISKPFSEEQFISTICKYLQNPGIPVVSFAVSTNEVPLFSLEKLNEISRGNEAFVQKMTALFKEQAPATVAEMKEAFLQGDLGRVKSLAHRLKPSLDNLAITSFTGGIRLIENFNVDCNPGGDLEGLINDLEEIVNKVTAAL